MKSKFKGILIFCLPLMGINYAHAGDHDLCGVYVRIINNSDYEFNATGKGNEGNYNWYDASGFENDNIIPPHSDNTNIYTAADGQDGTATTKAYQYFSLYNISYPINNYTFQITKLNGSIQANYSYGVRLTNTRSWRYIDANYHSMSIPSDARLAAYDIDYASRCHGRMKPRFTINIDSSGYVDDNQTLAGTY